MRHEWKFRGWDAVCSKGWVYGDLVHNIKITKEKDVPRVMVGGYEVVPESVGIFTGLNDMYGTPIYEGDVVETHYVQNGNNYCCEAEVKYEYNGFVLDCQGCFIPLKRIVKVVYTAYEKNKNK